MKFRHYELATLNTASFQHECVMSNDVNFFQHLLLAKKSQKYVHLRFRLSDHKQHTLDRLEKEVIKLKEDTNAKSEELDIRQRCLNEFQMMALDKQVRHVGDASKQEHPRRKNEIFFRYFLMSQCVNFMIFLSLRILREINFGGSRSSKNAFLPNLCALLDFVILIKNNLCDLLVWFN